MVTCQRLRKRADFQNLTHKSQAFKAPAFILLYAPYSEESTLRLGFTATKRSIGGAVKRNRAKRRLRAVSDKLMRLNPNFTLPEQNTGADLVLVARWRIADIPFEYLEKDLRKTLAEAGFGV